METVRIKRSLPLEHRSLCLSTSWCGLENLLGQCRLLQPTTQRAAKWIKFLTMNAAAHTNVKYKALSFSEIDHAEWNTAKAFWIKTRPSVCVAKQIRLTIRIIFKINYDQRLALKRADECTGFFYWIIPGPIEKIGNENQPIRIYYLRRAQGAQCYVGAYSKLSRIF